METALPQRHEYSIDDVLFMFDEFDVMIFRDLKSASVFLEPVDVQREETIAYDVRGMVYEAILMDPHSQLSSVVMWPNESRVESARALAERMRACLARFTKLDGSDLGSMSLPELLQVAIRVYGFC